MSSIIIKAGRFDAINIDELRKRLSESNQTTWIDIESKDKEKKKTLKQEILEICRDSDTGDSIRYFLFGPLFEGGVSSVTVDVASSIYEVHKETLSRSFEIHGIFILPASDASIEEKAIAYAILKEINRSRLNLDFVWLTEFSAGKTFTEKIYRFITTDIYSTFNNSARSTILTRNFLHNTSSYSTFDVYQLIFPCDQLIESLKNRLIGDILTRSPLKIVWNDAEVIQTIKAEFDAHLRERRNEDEVAEIKAKRLDIDTNVLIEEFHKGGTAGVDEFIDEVYRRVTILSERAKDRIINSDIKSYIEYFSKDLRSKAEAIMDNPKRGLYTSYAYFSYILGKDLPEIDMPSFVFQEDIKTYNLHTILMGTVKEDVLNILRSDRDEIIERLMKIYSKYDNPGLIWKGMERTSLDILLDMEATLDLSTFNDEDKGRAEMFKALRDEIISSIEHIDELLHDSGRWSVLFKSLEVLSKIKAGEKLLELNTIREQMNSAYNRLEAHRQKKKPLICGRKKYERLLSKLEEAHEALRRQYEDGKKELSSIIMDRKNFVFHQELILSLYEQAVSTTDSIRREISTFITTLRELVDKSSVDAAFDNYGSAYHVIKSDQISCYYFTEDKLPEIVEGFYRFLHYTPEPRISPYYKLSDQFTQGLQEFAYNCFKKLEDLSIEDVMSHLGNSHDALSSMNTFLSNRPIIKRFPEDNVESLLYIGVENERSTRLRDESCISAIQGKYEFYSTGDRHVVLGLKITHGFTLFSLQNIRELKKSYLNLKEEGREVHSVKEYEGLEDLIPEELE